MLRIAVSLYVSDSTRLSYDSQAAGQDLCSSVAITSRWAKSIVKNPKTVDP